MSAIWGGTPAQNPIGPAVFEGYLPDALRDGRHLAAPAAEVVGDGLGAVPGALDRLRAGVSARKLVVTV
ncbi:hypothetical protein [Quadrisphaera sp. INWT6]|uniref:hypothetical protein n=1 Tax=Quadrisphaera sp. INWT6 TaxID=2596917 RepID=UPI0019D52B5D|nr:hypothetical protein [Quadrisphaera sp. INWT6]